ncbi:MAG: cell division protein FtsL [Acidobacteria bacterium]|nr:cell division protein FtsL [Acidobacteriota bacterium]
MVDLAAGTEVRNYGLKRTPDPKILQESLILILPLAVIAAALAFSIWIRSEIIYSGYQKQDLKAQEEELLRSHQQLVVEEQILKDPRWLDAVAGNSLGMIIVRPDQIIPASFSNWKDDHTKSALIGNLVQPYGPKKPASFN